MPDEFLTDDELVRLERELRERANADRRDGAGTDADVNREQNECWFTRRKAAVRIEKSEGFLYEFACHEGNYSLAHLLMAARAAER